MTVDDFGGAYAAALGHHLAGGGESGLIAARDLGRRALDDHVSLLDVVEGHFRVLAEMPAPLGASQRDAAPRFLLTTLAVLDAGPRDRDGPARVADPVGDGAFRTALVNSIQEGFFLVDRVGTVFEVNEAFTAITGCDRARLPFHWPYPWLADQGAGAERLAHLMRTGSLHTDALVRHPGGRLAWTAVSVNSVVTDGDDHGVYVGTITDVTAARAATARDNAVVRLATSVGVATTVAEVLDILLDELVVAFDLTRLVAVTWPISDAGPVVQVAGSSEAPTWRDLDPFLREQFEAARGLPALTVRAIDAPGPSRGLMAVLSGVQEGALWLEHGTPRIVGEDDRSLIAALIGHLSLAVTHVRLFENARAASLTFQRTMLPTTKPPVGFAVRYEPAASPLEIGGDWYDVLAIDDHHVGIIVGDCVGSGLDAAAVMGQLRSSARVLLINGTRPARLIEELDSVAALIPGAYCATVFVGSIDTDTGHLTYSSAGHVPALLAVPGEAAETLTEAVSVPLAVERSGARPEAARFLSPSSTLMLYTDGLVERRDVGMDDGIGHAGDVLADTLGTPADSVADAVLSGLVPSSGFDDDVAIVVYRRPPAPLEIEVVATPDRLSEIRGQLGAWLWATGIPDDLAGDIVLVVNEACTNSIEHGYRAREPGLMIVFVEARGRGICIRISDFGSWKLPDVNPRLRGRGVPLMRAVSADVTLDGTSTGTVVTMNFQLT